MSNAALIRRVGTAFGLALLLSVAAVSPPSAQMPPNKTEIRSYKGLFSSVIRGNLAETQKLLAAGAKPNATDNKGRTPLHIAAHRRSVEMARVLVKGGADPSVVDGRGYDIVAIAAVQNDVKFLKAAIELGGNPKAIIGTWGGTALNVAAQLGHGDAVAVLIKAGAPVNHRNKAGWTPLIEAIVLGDGKAGGQAVVKALLDGGADPNIADRKDNTPFALAKKRRFSAIAALISKAGGR